MPETFVFVSFTMRLKRIFAQILVLFFWVGFWLPTFSQGNSDAIRLSPQSRVSVLTCGRGVELYEAFGHTAFRLQDPAQGLDLVFNYGVFDFRQENFYGNFAKGNLRYMLGLSAMSDFLEQYRRDGRSVREQILNLDSTEKQQIALFLSQNLLPQNREYLYNYFRDNCSTKIPDVLDSALNHRIQWTYADLDGHVSFRSLIHDYTTFHSWGRFGIDLGLGAPIDRSIKGKDLNFLPDELEKTLNRAKIRRGMLEFPLVLETRTLFEAPMFFGRASAMLQPSIVFSFVLLLVCLLVWKIPGSLAHRLTQTILLAFSGILGCVQLAIWLFTNHVDAAWNYNLLWANPGFLFLAPMALQLVPRWPGLWTGMQFYLAAVLVAWFWFPQELNVALIPWVASLWLLCGKRPPKVASKGA
jgi:hypothetical protein